jgi:hypothetical protein
MPRWECHPRWPRSSRTSASPAANQVIVRFTFGSEKAAWIHEVTEAFNADGVQTASGKRICVQAIPKGSGDSVYEVKDGEAGPHELHATSQVLVPQQSGDVIQAFIETYEQLGDPEGANL